MRRSSHPGWPRRPGSRSGREVVAFLGTQDPENDSTIGCRITVFVEGALLACGSINP
jgi:hypothetical protein